MNSREETIENIVYFNISDNWGDFYPVTIEEYQQMDQEFAQTAGCEYELSEFEEDYQHGEDVITRLTGDPNNPFEIIAIGYSDQNDDSQFDGHFVSLPDTQIAQVKNELRMAAGGFHTDLSKIMTPSEIENEFGLADGTVRQYLSRHVNDIACRKSGGTWIIHREEALRIWGNSA